MKKFSVTFCLLAIVAIAAIPSAKHLIASTEPPTPLGAYFNIASTQPPTPLSAILVASTETPDPEVFSTLS